MHHQASGSDTASVIIGFIAGGFTLIHSTDPILATFFGAAAVTVLFAGASFLGNKIATLLWKYKLEPWFKKIMKIK